MSFAHNNSYAALELLKPLQSTLNITVHVSTTATTGVLLYRGTGEEHLAVELFRGRLRISFRQSEAPVTNMFSYELLGDGIPHSIQLLLENQQLKLRVDSGQLRSALLDVNQFPQRHSTTSSAPLYVGGVPQMIGAGALRRWQLRASNSLLGCLNQLYVNGKRIDFAAAGIVRRHLVTAGCASDDISLYSGHSQMARDEGVAVDKMGRGLSAHGRDYSEKRRVLRDGCGPDGTCGDGGRCRKSKNIFTDENTANYYCECKKGWTGKFCDKKPSCGIKSKLVYHRQGGCRSRRQIRMRQCSGSCHGDSCCQPVRWKTRRVRMVCRDRRRFTKELKMIRRCRCQSGTC